MAWAKRFTVGLATYAGLFLCFRYWGDFSKNQSAILALIFIIGGGFYESLKATGRSQRHLYPYSVLVVPQWHYLLLDYKFVKDAEEFQKLWEEGLKDTPLLRFTVLQPEDNADLPGLIYWDSRKSFVTGVDFEEPVKAITFEEPNSLIKSLNFPPRELTWSLRSGSGYELGLTVPTEWWQRIRAKGEIGELAETVAEADALTGSTRLVVATLPLQEFDVYYHKIEFVDREHRQKQKELADRQLSESRWKRKDRAGAEIADPWHRLEHRYFTVQHRSI